MKESEVLSWRWNIHQESTMHAGSGLSVPVRSPSLIFHLNITSIAPARTCSNTALPVSIPQADLVMRKAGGNRWSTSSTLSGI